MTTETRPPGCICVLEESYLRFEYDVICDEYDEYVGFGGAWCKSCFHRKACHVDESDEIDNRPLDESDEGDKSVLQDIVRLLFQRLGEAALEIASLKELLADRESDLMFEYKSRVAAEEKLLLAEDTASSESRFERALRVLGDCCEGIECLCIEPPDEYENPEDHAQYCHHYMIAVIEAALENRPFPE